MPGFDAGKAVTDLSWDFSTVPGLDSMDEETQAVLRDARGVIPEPTQKRLDEFIKAMQSVASDPAVAAFVALGDNPDPTVVVAALDDVPEDALQQINDRMLTAIVSVCGGSPSEEQLRALPPRPRNAFVGWVSGELVGPTGPTSASSRSLATSTNGASAT